MFETNKTSLDWLTLTTYTPSVMSVMYDWHMAVGKEREAKKMQYAGTTTADRYGTSFLGIATQRDRQHCMLQVSGSLAESALSRLRPFILDSSAKCTRIDLQVTIPYNRSIWSQIDLFQALRDDNGNRRATNYIESFSGPQGTALATVYIGSRSSDNCTRIYEKLGLGDEVYLRFETEYKAERAQQIAISVANEESKQGLLWAQVLRLPDVYYLREEFSKALKTRPIYTKIVHDQGNTARWLREVVAPSLDRYLSNHDEDTITMIELFARIINDHVDMMCSCDVQ